jgi:nucleoside-diphosphate-sugar epimerase
MKTVLVTGAKGCIGAWTLRVLLDQGHNVISLDLPGNMHRLELILGDDLNRVKLIDGDILDAPAVAKLVQDEGVTNIVHLAALQVPAARAKPTLGAQINVVGTVNVFEAARAAGIRHIAYASSIAAYSPTRTFEPQTLYGVWKLANEGTARVYHLENGISSIALRPNVVYGLGRDFGLTSSPTFAMLAAAAGKGYHIPYASRMVYQSGRDIGLLFARAALHEGYDGAGVFDPPGTAAITSEVIAAINRVVPDVTITHGDTVLPFPSEYDAEALEAVIGPVQMESMDDGIAQAVADFRAALAAGKIAVPENAV